MLDGEWGAIDKGHFVQLYRVAYLHMTQTRTSASSISQTRRMPIQIALAVA